jgi:2-polyprenyl-3-methyl-5-hydroxy-6-metoxy-1,4-benzoquinol methylase
MSFLIQPTRAFEFTSPVFDYINNRLLWIKPISSIIFANPKLRAVFTRREINERIVETPFVLGNLPTKGRILDVGACESPISLMLASSGYKVWANDTRPYHFSHPNLKNVVGSVTELTESAPFDVVICLSTLEHVGFEAYGNKTQEGLDKKAVGKMWQVLKPGGKLLLTTPIDRHHKKISLSRVYTISELKNLLSPFSKVDIKVGYKDRKEKWKVSRTLPKDFRAFGERECAVALISAIK